MKNTLLKRNLFQAVSIDAFFLLNIIKFVAERIHSKIQNNFYRCFSSLAFLLYIIFFFNCGELTNFLFKRAMNQNLFQNNHLMHLSVFNCAFKSLTFFLRYNIFKFFRTFQSFYTLNITNLSYFYYKYMRSHTT